MPICPFEFEPQLTTLPSVLSSSAWLPPPATCALSLPTVARCTGAVEHQQPAEESTKTKMVGFFIPRRLHRPQHCWQPSPSWFWAFCARARQVSEGRFFARVSATYVTPVEKPAVGLERHASSALSGDEGIVRTEIHLRRRNPAIRVAEPKLTVAAMPPAEHLTTLFESERVR